MKIKDRLKKAVIGGLAGLVALTATSEASAALFPMEVSTVPVSSSGYFERGGDYQLEVYADSTMNPSQTIISSQWDVVVPSYITITGARLPSLDNPNTTNPADFFYGSFLMGNDLKTIVAGGELTLNARASDDGTSGAKNKKGLLEIIDFKINNNATLGNSNFDLNDVYFLDSDLNVYDSPAGVSPAINTPFTIVPEPATFGMLGLGALGLALKKRRYREYAES